VTHATGGLGRASSLARNQYQEGQILRARDLERESDYFLARDRQHNALAHGPGILVGLQLVAYKAGTETPVTQEQLFNAPPQALDLAVTAGAAIDYAGRLIIVPKRVPVRLDLAREPSVLDAGTYRLELLYRHADVVKGPRGSECDQPRTRGVLEEGYQLRLIEFDPDEEKPQLNVGTVLDGPVDDPAVLAPITLGLIQWNGTAYDGYSAVLRTLAPVTAQRMHAPDDRAEVELRDVNDRFAVRFAKMPSAGSEDPFTPGPLLNRLTVDEEGATWVRADVSVGPQGVGFRTTPDTTTPSELRIGVMETLPGATFRKKPDGVTLLGPDEYEAGARELRVVFQREAGTDDGTGRNRLVIGMVDPAGTFEPALVVYDHPPGETQRGFGIVEICGDLYVRGTTYVHSVHKYPEDADQNEQLDFILRQLAGPLAGVFRAFLSSDPTWLQQFAGVMGQQVASTAAVRATFVSALIADPGFVNAVTNAAVAQAVAQAIPQAVAAVQNATNMPGLVSAITTFLDDQNNPAPMPADPARRVLAAIYRRLLTSPATAHTEIRDSVTQNTATLDKIDKALEWLLA